jgi:hypothetical protein
MRRVGGHPASSDPGVWRDRIAAGENRQALTPGARSHMLTARTEANGLEILKN